MKAAASLFGKKVERKSAQSFIQTSNKKPFDSMDMAKIDMDFQEKEEKITKSESLNNQNTNKEKSKYILSAIKKADERKILQGEVRKRRYERELAKWEIEHQSALKFSTFDINENSDKVNGDIIDNQTDTNDIIKEQENVVEQKKSLIPTEKELEEMLKRYLKRMEDIDILHFSKDKKAQIELLYYPEICGIPVLTEDHA